MTGSANPGKAKQVSKRTLLAGFLLTTIGGYLAVSVLLGKGPLAIAVGVAAGFWLWYLLSLRFPRIRP
jgi:hypothetical protein